MSVAIITGSSGLVGSAAVKFFHEKGLEVVGIDNNLREYFFGADGSTASNAERLRERFRNFQHEFADIRDQNAMERIFSRYGKKISVVIHTAGQPSHEWAAREPLTDFTVNANGTLVLLESTRKFCLDAPFIFTSSNKVYGDTPNFLPLVEREWRWEVDEIHPYAKFGIDESMSIDRSKHSLFGASKVAADVLTQEYGRYFGMRTGVFRGGCLTGPAHSGAELHGFLAYLVKCIINGKKYTVFGYKGKQVRDNLHSHDLANAFWHFFQSPKSGAVYNIGGSRHSNCSVLEAIRLTETLVGEKLDFTISEKARAGDHIWWISDVRRFQQDYPGWSCKYSIKEILEEIVMAAQERSKN